MKIIVLITSLCLLLTSCWMGQTRLLSLATDIPEFAAYIEYFNTNQNRYKILLQYTDTPALSLQSKNNLPDLIIYKNLATPALLPFFEPLDDILGPENLRPETIYPELMRNGMFNEKQVLLPLAFSLPMIIFKTENLDDDFVSLILPLETLKSKALTFFPGDQRRYGFSPFWNDEFLLSTAHALGSDFRLNESGNFYWDESALSGTVDFFSQWLTEMPGGYAQAAQFTERYLTIPPYRLLIQDKILYYYADSSYLYSIPIEIRKNIDFRWLTADSKIPVLDNVTYIGISERSTEKKAAKFFLTWLLDPSVQARLLETNNYKRMTGIFGLANQFSSLIEVNEKYIPQNHPFMVSHIPEADFLHFPGQLPDNWPTIRKKILEDWFPAVLFEPEAEKNLENLLNF